MARGARLGRCPHSARRDRRQGQVKTLGGEMRDATPPASIGKLGKVLFGKDVTRLAGNQTDIATIATGCIASGRDRGNLAHEISGRRHADERSNRDPGHDAFRTGSRSRLGGG